MILQDKIQNKNDFVNLPIQVVEIIVHLHHICILHEIKSDMKHVTLIILSLIFSIAQSNGQSFSLDKISFLIGEWSGTGNGFGNEKSRIKSSFQLVMDDNYIEVMNESFFDPTEEKPEGEHHLDKGFISYDKIRGKIIFRQFNNEGYYNQYVLNDSISNENMLVFETEFIENFVPNGKAKWTIKKINGNDIETVFDVSFGNEYTCFGRNRLNRN